MKHHSADIFEAKGTKHVGGVLSPFIADVPLQVDVVSCDGPGNPWKGKAGVPPGVTLGALIKAGAQIAGKTIPADASKLSNMNDHFGFQLQDGSGEQSFFVVAAETRLDALERIPKWRKT